MLVIVNNCGAYEWLFAERRNSEQYPSCSCKHLGIVVVIHCAYVQAFSRTWNKQSPNALCFSDLHYIGIIVFSLCANIDFLLNPRFAPSASIPARAHAHKTDDVIGISVPGKVRNSCKTTSPTPLEETTVSERTQLCLASVASRIDSNGKETIRLLSCIR